MLRRMHSRRPLPKVDHVVGALPAVVHQGAGASLGGAEHVVQDRQVCSIVYRCLCIRSHDTMQDEAAARTVAGVAGHVGAAAGSRAHVWMWLRHPSTSASVRHGRGGARVRMARARRWADDRSIFGVASATPVSRCTTCRPNDAIPSSDLHARTVISTKAR